MKAVRISDGTIFVPIVTERNETVQTNEQVVELLGGVYQVVDPECTSITVNVDHGVTPPIKTFKHYERLSDTAAIPRIIESEAEMQVQKDKYIGIENLYRKVFDTVAAPQKDDTRTVPLSDFTIIDVDTSMIAEYDPAWQNNPEFIGFRGAIGSLLPGRLTSVAEEATNLLSEYAGVTSVTVNNVRGKVTVRGKLSIGFEDGRFTWEKKMFSRSRKLEKVTRYERFEFSVELPSSVSADTLAQAYVALDDLLASSFDMLAEPDTACTACDGRGYKLHSDLRPERR